MNRTAQQHLRSPLTLSLLSLSFCLLPPVSCLLPALAASPPTALHFAAPRLPEDPGEPGGRGRGGASRIPTCKPYRDFTALVPIAQNKTKTLVWGLTTLDHPTFWFYLPQTLKAGMPLKFVLRDRDDNPLYETTVQPPIPAGIIRVSLPHTTAPLKVNQSYRWGVSVQCDPADAGALAWQEGSIQRVAGPTDLQESLKAAKTPLDRAIVYAENGIWFEALNTLANEIQQHGTTDRAIVSAWTDLLKQGQLRSVTKGAIAPCCQLN
ncbi:MAG: DUF928 domain-containing protein [Leptolyngbya sp. BL-A-14]